MQHQTAAMLASSTGQPSPDDVRAELGRVLSSPQLQASARRRGFLRFVVEETLAGRAGRLKGYAIATAVFDRDDSFDPQSDPVVRIEARRLRRDLDSYYVDAGSRNPIRISIPKGSYVPHFETRDPSSRQVPAVEAAPEDASDAVPPPTEAQTGARAERPGRGSLRVAAGAALLAVMLGVGLLSWKGAPSPGVGTGEPQLAVLPFEALNDSETGRALAEGIGQELVRHVMQFEGFRLYMLPPRSEAADGLDPVARGRELGLAYIVTGSVRTHEERVGVETQVLDAATGRVLWAGRHDRELTPGSIMRVPAEIAGEIATTIGQPYGVVNSDLVGRAADADGASMESYVCVLRAYAFRRSFAFAELGPVRDCLERAVQRDPTYADAWAMLGWIHVDEGRIDYLGTGDRGAAYERALQATTRAYSLDPENTRALKALAAVNHYLGRYAISERLARRALELNPNDPETMAQLGWRLAIRGKSEEGIALLKQAIERTLNPPSWYFHLVGIDLHLRGDHAEMRGVAERAALNDSGVGQALLAIACAEQGDVACTRRALDHMARAKPFARDPEGFLRRHGAMDEVVEPVLAGLEKARRLASRPGLAAPAGSATPVSLPVIEN